jgi:hypothetical protein
MPDITVVEPATQIEKSGTISFGTWADEGIDAINLQALDAAK